MSGLVTSIPNLISQIEQAIGFGGSTEVSPYLTPQQAALNAYNAHQQKLAAAERTSGTGTEMSMATTMGFGAANLNRAAANASQADVNAANTLASLVNQTQQNQANTSFSQGAQSEAGRQGTPGTFSNQGDTTQGGTTGGVGSTGIGGIGSA